MAAAFWPPPLLRQAGSWLPPPPRARFRTRRSWATLPPFLRPLPGPRPHPRPQPDSRCGPGPDALGTEALRLRGLRNAGRSVDVARPYVGGERTLLRMEGGWGRVLRPCADILGLAGHVPKVFVGLGKGP